MVFNNVIQGPTICNNGYLLYDPRANPGYTVSGGDGKTGGATPLRTVESHPRGSIEGGYHIGGAGVGGPGGSHGVPGRVGSPWLSQASGSSRCIANRREACSHTARGIPLPRSEAMSTTMSTHATAA